MMCCISMGKVQVKPCAYQCSISSQAASYFASPCNLQIIPMMLVHVHTQGLDKVPPATTMRFFLVSCMQTFQAFKATSPGPCLRYTPRQMRQEDCANPVMHKDDVAPPWLSQGLGTWGLPGQW